MFDQVCTLIKVLCLIEQGTVCSTWKLHLPWLFSIDFLQVTWIFNLLQYLHLNLVSMSWKHYGKFDLVVSGSSHPGWTCATTNFCINILCSSSVHLPLFILLFGKLACTLFPDSKRNNAAKPDCTLPRGDDGSLNEGHSSGELMVNEINTESEYNSNLQIGME